eukprot:Nk52_evm2s1193 gene=Nk52_evmTU2s1193
MTSIQNLLHFNPTFTALDPQFLELLPSVVKNELADYVYNHDNRGKVKTLFSSEFIDDLNHVQSGTQINDFPLQLRQNRARVYYRKVMKYCEYAEYVSLRLKGKERVSLIKHILMVDDFLKVHNFSEQSTLTDVWKEVNK